MVIFMLTSLSSRAGRAALVMSAALASAMPAPAQYGATVETPEAALARNLRLIAANPRDFQALVAAGKAALETGDTQTAAGFYGRAEDISPRSWQPQAGMANVMIAMADPAGALRYFTRAQEFGATHMLIALDRGLAFDLMGDQARAQSDYRVAMQGAQADEARRRMALSLAISRDIKSASQTIDPLLRRGDREAVRINAFVLALAGDREGARRAIDAAMPGTGASFEPFFKLLPVLGPAEKAAAVHLGIFPRDAAQRQAQAGNVPLTPVASIGTPAPQAPRSPVRQVQESSTYAAPVRTTLEPSRLASARVPRSPATTSAKAAPADADPEPRPVDRLGDIAKLLSEQSAEQESESLVKVADAQPVEPAPEPAFSDVPVSKPKVEAPKPKASKPKADSKKAAEEKKKAEKLAAEKKAKAEAEKKAKAEAAKLGVKGTNWVQIAGGSNQDRMGVEYKKLAAKAGSLLKSRAGYVTEGKEYFRLLVGPFPSTDEAQEFVRKLDKAGVDSFRWTRNPAHIRIEKLKS